MVCIFQEKLHFHLIYALIFIFLNRLFFQQGQKTHCKLVEILEISAF
jgi:hypothetical protein